MALARRQTDAEATINLTPMIDVVFLLIIFFMVGSKIGDNHVDVNLPQSGQNQSMVRGPDRRLVSVDASGGTALDNQWMALEEIQQTLSQQVASYPDLRVAFRGDANVSLQRAMEVMRVIRSSGVSQIDISDRNFR